MFKGYRTHILITTKSSCIIQSSSNTKSYLDHGPHLLYCYYVESIKHILNGSTFCDIFAFIHRFARDML